MPTLYVLGGANGVGKTTWYTIGIEDGYINPSLPFINIDNIQKELGGYTSGNTIKAEGIARGRMKELISQKVDFLIESNLAKSSDYEWVNRMREQGYQTSLFFLSTENVEINKERVIQRVSEGGHAVPEPIIEQRYRMGLSYLKKEILSFDNVRLIDTTGSPPKVMAVLHQGKIISREQGAALWVNEVLFLAERLQQKELQKLSPEKKPEQSLSLNKENQQTRGAQQEQQQEKLKEEQSQKQSAHPKQQKDRGPSL